MKATRYTKYKKSSIQWLAEVPQHWEIKALKYFCSITTGFAFKSEEFKNDGIPLLRISDIKTDGTINLDEAKYLDESELQLHPNETLRTGDIAMAMTGATIGKAGIYKSLKPSLLNQRVCVYRAKPGSDQLYIWFLLASKIYQENVNITAFGGAQPNISDSELLQYFCPYPPIKEQQLISAFLDRETTKIDALINKQEQLIELLQEKRQAVISHAVTKGLNPNSPMKDSSVEWLGEVPEHWEITRLKHVKSKQKNAFVDGPFGSNLKSEHYVEDGNVLVVESGFATTGKLNENDLKRITEEHFATVSRSEAREGDIIIAKIGARYGMSSILPRVSSRAVISGNSLKLTVDTETLNIEYSHYLLLVLKACGAMDEDVNVTAQPALSLGCLNNILFLRPPLNEQTFIVEEINRRCGKLDSLIAAAHKMAETLSERRSALISAAVTGQIDVRGLVSEEEAA